MSLHAKIMNIPASGEPAGGSMAYKLGHRDARHAAAELAFEDDRLKLEMARRLRDLCEWLESVPGGLGDEPAKSVFEARKLIKEATS